MKLEVGKYYRTRDGRKVSVMSISSKVAEMSDGGHLFEYNGNHTVPTKKRIVMSWHYGLTHRCAK